MSPDDALAIGFFLVALLPVFGWVWNFVILSLTSDYLIHRKIDSPKIFLASLATSPVWFCLFFLHIGLANKVHFLRYGNLTPSHDQIDLWLSIPFLIIIMILAVLFIIKNAFRLTWRESLRSSTVAGVLLAPWMHLFYLHWFLFVILATGLWVMKRIKEKPWLKTTFLLGLGTTLVVSLFFAGYKLGQKQVQPSSVSPPTIIPSPTLKPKTTHSLDETGDWKSYTNTKYGYSIKYPNSWFLNFDSPEGQQFSNIKSESPFDTKARVDVSSISRKEFDEKYRSKVGTNWEVAFKTTEEKVANLIVDDRPAVKLIRIPSEGATSPAYIIEVLVAKDNNVFEISSWGKNKEDQLKYDITFDLMLSTFRFFE